MRPRGRVWAAVLCLFGWTLTAPALPALSADGWAGENGGTTGGTGGITVTVSTAEDFLRYATTDTRPHVIQIKGTINLGNDEHRIKSNKTLIGLGRTGGYIGTLTFVRGTRNVIVKNLTITTYDQVSDRDGISIRGATNIWVDHCTFVDCKDGSVDQGVGADFVTVSWCRFYYTSPGSNKPNLVGSNDAHGATDEGRLRTTFHHNWYGEHCSGRMPMARFGRVHVYNTYFNSMGGNMYFGVAYRSQILAENNYFEGGNQEQAKIWYSYHESGRLRQTGNVFVAVPVNPTGGDDEVFTPPYAYELDDARAVKAIVTRDAGVNGDDGRDTSTRRSQPEQDAGNEVWWAAADPDAEHMSNG